MKSNTIFAALIGLAAGLIIGFTVANTLNRNAEVKQTGALDPNASAVNPAGNQSAGQIPPGMLENVQKTLEVAQNQPDNYEAQLEAGRMYARIQNFEKALDFFRKAQELKPDDFEANAFLGNAYLDARQFDDAEKYYEKALQIKPDNVTVRSDLAATYIQRDQPDYERAFAEFKKALEIDPKHEATIYNMGIAYLRKGEKENAQKVVEQLKAANPESDLIPKLEQLVANK
jgi:Flp pilus assembly protein TadD